MSNLTKSMEAIIEEHGKFGPLPIEKLTPEIARQIPLIDQAAISYYGHHLSKKAMAPFPLNVGSVENKVIEGPESDLIIRIYTPEGDKPQNGWPVTVYFHGGGWVIADLNTYDASCRNLCKGADTIVVSVHYRQAPENKWPAAKDDAFAAYQWVLKNAFSFNGNPQQIAIAGESAGGNLAAITCLLAKENNVSLPVHQLLVYPVTDLAEGMKSPSALAYKDAKPLNTPMLTWFYNFYVPEGVDRKDPHLSPLYADNLSGLPATTIILAEFDPLCSEGKSYGDKLYHAGVPTDMKIFEGVTHEFFGLAGLVGQSTDAMKFACDNLKSAFKFHKKDRLAA